MGHGAKLGLGTVQWGCQYGISNQTGKTSLEEVGLILERARVNDVATIDTAALYGDAESALGTYSLSAFNVVTKTPRFGINSITRHNASQLRTTYLSSLSKMRLDIAYAMATAVHPRAFVSPSAVVGQGSAIMAGAIVGTEASLGVGTIVNCGAVVDHHATIEDFGHLGVNASMAGGTVLGRGAWMQVGAALGYGVKVRSGVTLDPGEAVDVKTNKYKND